MWKITYNFDEIGCSKNILVINIHTRYIGYVYFVVSLGKLFDGEKLFKGIQVFYLDLTVESGRITIPQYILIVNQ